MELNIEQQRRQAHWLLDGLPEEKLTVVRNLLEVLTEHSTDSLSQSLANAPWEDEEIDEDEEQAVAKSEAWLAANPGQGTPHEDVLAEFGFTAGEAERMARTPPEPNGAAR